MTASAAMGMSDRPPGADARGAGAGVGAGSTSNRPWNQRASRSGQSGREEDRRRRDREPREDPDVEERGIRGMEGAVDDESRKPRAVPQQKRRPQHMQRDRAPCPQQDEPVVVEQEAEGEIIRLRAQPHAERLAGKPVGRQLHQPRVDQHDLHLQAQDRDAGIGGSPRPARAQTASRRVTGPGARAGNTAGSGTG